MNNRIVAMIGAGLIVGAGAIVLTLGDKSVAIDGGVASPIREVTEADIADIAYVSPEGDAIHIVGVQPSGEKTVIDTSIGRAVTVSEIPPEAICQVVIEANDDKGKPALTKELNECYEKVPVMQPVKISGSQIGKSWFWFAAFRGDCCKKIMAWVGSGSILSVGAGYFGSSMAEFLTHSSYMKARFLRTFGQCSADGGFQNCVVPVGDSKAIPGSDIFFPMELAERHDMKFMPVKSGKIEPRQVLPVKLDGGVAPIKEPIEP